MQKREEAVSWKTQVFNRQVHVIPVADLRPHNEEGIICWCEPEVEENIVVHHAMDEREQYETGERKPS